MFLTGSKTEVLVVVVMVGTEKVSTVWFDGAIHITAGDGALGNS